MKGAKCIKCGMADLPARFCDGKGTCRVTGKQPDGEHMDVTCGECGYIGVESCKDAR